MTVEAGQVLVKGIVPIVNDVEEVVNQYTVRADADVTARTVNGYSKSFPLMHTERVATGRTRRGWYVKAGKCLVYVSCACLGGATVGLCDGGAAAEAFFQFLPSILSGGY